MRSSDVGSYQGRPLDFGGRFVAGFEGSAFYASAAYGAGLGFGAYPPPATSDDPGSYYLLGQPTVLCTWICTIGGLIAPGDTVVFELQVNGVTVHTFTCVYDASTPGPGGIGTTILIDFEPIVLDEGSRVAVIWSAVGNTVDAGTCVAYLQ